MTTRILLALAALTLAAEAPAQQVAAVASAHSSATVTVKLGQSALVNGRRFRAVSIVEDSRCPPNANCVWAGRLVVDAKYGRQKLRLEMGKPVDVRGGRVTLADATPPAPAGRKLAAARYRLQVRFERP